MIIEKKILEDILSDFDDNTLFDINFSMKDQKVTFEISTKLDRFKSKIIDRMIENRIQ